MYCERCGTLNEKDAYFCKRCGFNFLYEEVEKKKNKSTSPKKQKVRTKTKVKKKVKKVKEKSKPDKKKEKVIVKKQMGVVPKIIMFLLFLFILILLVVCGALGYQLYSNENIEVPNVVMMSYEEAEETLRDKHLNIEMKELVVDTEESVGIVLEQSKKAGKKVSKNTVIKVTVGILEESILVPDVVGMHLDQAKNTLNHQNISYTISYQETEDEKENIVLSQSLKANSKIKKGQKIELIVSKGSKSLDPSQEDEILEEE